MIVGCQSYKLIASPLARRVQRYIWCQHRTRVKQTLPNFPDVLPKTKPNLLLRRLMAKGPTTQTEETFDNYALGPPPPSLSTPSPQWHCPKGWAALALQPGAPLARAFWKHVERALAIAQRLAVTSSSSLE